MVFGIEKMIDDKLRDIKINMENDVEANMKKICLEILGEIITEYDMSNYHELTGAFRGLIDSAIDKTVGEESFIDNVVERIKKKQINNFRY